MSILRYLGLSLILVVFTACGSSGGGNLDGDASTEDDATVPPIDSPKKPGDPPPACVPKTCDELAKDGRIACGEVAASDGCGDVVRCADPAEANHGCPAGFYCMLEDDGVARCQEREAEECTPTPKVEACAGLDCGFVPTGCYGETYDCGSCVSGFCQANVCQPNECTTLKDCSNAGPGGTPVSCGRWPDGCASVLDCDLAPDQGGAGGCGLGEVCNFATGECVEDKPGEHCLSLEEACADTCGVVSDGCGGTHDCASDPRFSCAPEEHCAPPTPGAQPKCVDFSEKCIPDTAELEAKCVGKCGFISNGCDDVFDCSDAPGGVVCEGGDTCGGGGVHNQCGRPDSGCVPEAEAATCDGKCGDVLNNCGDVVHCGGCPAGETCGLGGPSICGPSACQPLDPSIACADKCGRVSDGCDGEYNCAEVPGGIATCPFGQACGYDGNSNVCGGPSCTPTSCEAENATCGKIPDRCGGSLTCWPEGVTECADPAVETCKTTLSGRQECTTEGGTGGCQGPLCGHIPVCPENSPTRIIGYVTTPDGELRVPNAVVYITRNPDDPLPPIREGVDPELPEADRCDRCSSENDGLGPVLAGAITDHEGRFALTGQIPTGVPVKLVIKAGRWRRVVIHTFDNLNTCADNEFAVGNSLFRLPGRHAAAHPEDHLPKIAVATGRIDAMECVLLKMGVDISEFTTRDGDGRIHMYRANGGRMCRNPLNQNGSCSGGGSNDISVSAANLTDPNANNGDIYDYDMVLWDCERDDQARQQEPRRRVRDYVNSGGRFFASHYARDWLNYPDTFGAIMSGGNNVLTTSDRVYLSFGRDRANTSRLRTYARWLDVHNAATVLYESPGTPRFAAIDPVREPRDLVGSINQGADEWAYRTTGSGNANETDDGLRARNNVQWNPNASGRTVQQFSFNTPLDSGADACGRVAYTAFHVVSEGGLMDVTNRYFPDYCSDEDTLTPQEKTLAYMIFDLAACISEGEPPQPPECEPATEDACAENACGTFSDGCGGTYDCGDCPFGEICSLAGVCESSCEPQTCSSLGYECGVHSDGCYGVTENCGTCPEGEICGLYEPGKCGGCKPIRCEDVGAECGEIPDGCGGVTPCEGVCENGEVCGGGGVPNQCGAGVCTPSECGENSCGTISDGCGGTRDCGECADGFGCGLVEPNLCSPICVPLDQEEACAGFECGFVPDGCGGVHDCGDCANGGECGGAGPNMCGEPCEPTDCAAQGANCGFILDGCGGLIPCGDCEGEDVCGAREPNVCGVGVCHPITDCSEASAECGSIPDGCEGELECGACPPGFFCTNDNRCEEGEGACFPKTCAELGAECGETSDGCGGLLDCGSCPSGQVCGIFAAHTCGSTG